LRLYVDETLNQVQYKLNQGLGSHVGEIHELKKTIDQRFGVLEFQLGDKVNKDVFAKTIN
jgi:hypothetical protein